VLCRPGGARILTLHTAHVHRYVGNVVLSWSVLNLEEAGIFFQENETSFISRHIGRIACQHLLLLQHARLRQIKGVRTGRRRLNALTLLRDYWCGVACVVCAIGVCQCHCHETESVCAKMAAPVVV
jgi:hypothetical protein